MWNGIGKLAVMVGVVGIGLFAVFQAQKGMTRIAGLTAPDAANDVAADPSDENGGPDNGTPFNSMKEEPLVVSVGDSDQRKSPDSTRRASASGRNRIDLVRNLESEPSSITPALGSANRKLTLANRESRPTGLSFQDDDEEPFSDTTEVAPAPPQSLPDEAFGAESTSEETTKQTPERAGSSAEDEFTESEAGSNVTAQDAAPESTEDPFKDQAPIAGDDSEESPKLRKQLDFGDDADIPRSKRGMETSERKREKTSVEEDTNSFDSEANAMAAPPAIDPDAEVADSPPELETPNEQVDEPSLEEPAEEPLPIPSGKPRNLPAELSSPADDDTVRARSQPSRNRPKLPADLEEEPAGTRQGRTREPLPQKSEPERVAPVDMIGDGVAGDPSQRGAQQPRLTIEKIAQQQAVLNQPLVYTIIVRNNGTVAAHHIVIEDRIPKGTELLGTSPRAELVGKTLVWKEEILRPNEQKKISIQVVPKQEGPIGSVARVHFATEVSAEIQVAAPQLEFNVNAPPEVRLGQNFDLVFQLKNVGKVEASNISVRDLVPDLLKHETGNDIECPIGKLAPNEVREIVLPVIATKTGSGVNRAVLTADGGIQKHLESTIAVIGDQLVLTRTGHNRVYVERPAVFTNTIRNEGNLKVSQVRIAEIVPAGMEFETASDGGKFDAARNAVVWTLGPLAPGDDRALTVKYVPKETGTLSGKITATGATGSTAVVNSSVEVVGRPELQMETLSATGVVTVGDKITSKFQLKNTGSATARNVQLRIQLPPELRLVNVRGTKFQKTKNNTVIFDPIDELSPRSHAAFELVLEPTEEADARMSIEISANHLTKPHRREETIQIARDALKE